MPQLRFDLKDLFKVSDGLKRLGGETEVFMRRIAQTLTASAKERFVDETDPEGNKWKKGVKNGGQTLTLSGLLRRSITNTSDDKTAVIGTNRIYAGIHQFGGVITAKKSKYLRFKINGREVFAKSVVIPARPFLGVSETDKDAVKDELNTLLTEALK
nr:MAG TPA: virion morphogenesis protein [Caudoviricetes sp.]